jgi:bifunctional DNA-binding transcriptional regulator/antitoxin component of YhaV-PrlF toxin-antitoxin module
MTEQASRVHLKVGAAGRVVLPQRFREDEDIKPGDELVGFIDNGELRIMTRRRAIQYVQDMVTSKVPRERSLADELIEERRREASAG